MFARPNHCYLPFSYFNGNNMTLTFLESSQLPNSEPVSQSP